jgi:hypothetical protein
MPVGEIAALPADLLAVLQEEAEESAKAARSLADWLNGAIALRYADRAAAARRADGKDTGTVTRQAMAWAKTRPEAFSEKTGNPDTRGAYGLLAREVIGLLKHLQHAEGKTVIFVGILERVTDDMGRVTWQQQMEGGKAARELPGIVDQVITMSLFSPDGDGWRHDPEKGEHRRLVCRAGNGFAVPAKDRSGRLDVTEPADLGALLAKINTTKG